MSTAAERVARYLEQQATLGGMDHEHLHTVHGEGEPAELRASDLRELLRVVEEYEELIEDLGMTSAGRRILEGLE